MIHGPVEYDCIFFDDAVVADDDGTGHGHDGALGMEDTACRGRVSSEADLETRRVPFPSVMSPLRSASWQIMQRDPMENLSLL
jgi:hypothetical protein